jgi:hypothetical protein
LSSPYPSNYTDCAGNVKCKWDTKWWWLWKLMVTVTHILTFKWPVLTSANTPKKRPLEIHFIYLGNIEIYCIFKMRCKICFTFQKIPFIS